MSAAVLGVNILDAHSLIASFGAVGVALVLFAETGLLIGFFLPGDSLLFTAGVLAATPVSAAAHVPLGEVLIAAPIGAIAGAQVGYIIGRRAGPALFRRSRPRLVTGRDRAEAYLRRYGHARAIVLARFVPVVRTVLNPLAGVLAVPRRTFALWQVVGGALWSIGVVVAGYWLGSAITNVDHYLLPIVAVVVVLSVLPIALEVVRERRRRAAELQVMLRAGREGR